MGSLKDYTIYATKKIEKVNKVSAKSTHDAFKKLGLIAKEGTGVVGRPPGG